MHISLPGKPQAHLLSFFCHHHFSRPQTANSHPRINANTDHRVPRTKRTQPFWVQPSSLQPMTRSTSHKTDISQQSPNTTCSPHTTTHDNARSFHHKCSNPCIVSSRTHSACRVFAFVLAVGCRNCLTPYLSLSAPSFSS